MAVDVLSHVDISKSNVLGDKAYGTNEILDYIQRQDSEYTIPPKANTVNPWRCDRALYKERHLVECFFLKPALSCVIGSKTQVFENIKIRFTAAIQSLPDKQNVEALLVAYGLLPGYNKIALLKDRREKYGQQVKRK